LILQYLEARYGDHITSIAGFYRDGRGRLCWTIPRGCALYGYRSQTGFYNGILCQPLWSIDSFWLLTSAKFGGPKAIRLKDSDAALFEAGLITYPAPPPIRSSLTKYSIGGTGMTSPFRKLSPGEIVEKQDEMVSQQKALAKKNGKNGHQVLPPQIDRRFDDVATAERFLDIFGEELQFLSESNKWLKWDGKRWSADTNDSVLSSRRSFAGDLYSPEKGHQQRNARVCSKSQ
jgi:hypothetical protein